MICCTPKDGLTWLERKAFFYDRAKLGLYVSMVATRAIHPLLIHDNKKCSYHSFYFSENTNIFSFSSWASSALTILFILHSSREYIFYFVSQVYIYRERESYSHILQKQSSSTVMECDLISCWMLMLIKIAHFSICLFPQSEVSNFVCRCGKEAK